MTVHPKPKSWSSAIVKVLDLNALVWLFLNRKSVQVRYVLEVLHDHNLSPNIMSSFYKAQNVYISSQSYKAAVLSRTIIKVIDIKKRTLNGWIDPLPTAVCT